MTPTRQQRKKRKGPIRVHRVERLTTEGRMLSRINDCKQRIAQARDELREIIFDATCIADSSDVAVESLEMAADALSEYL